MHGTSLQHVSLPLLSHELDHVWMLFNVATTIIDIQGTHRNKRVTSGRWVGEIGFTSCRRRVQGNPGVDGNWIISVNDQTKKKETLTGSRSRDMESQLDNWSPIVQLGRSEPLSDTPNEGKSVIEESWVLELPRDVYVGPSDRSFRVPHV